MDSILPDDVFLEITQHLSSQDIVRMGRVSKSFYRKSKLAIPHVKALNFSERIFGGMSDVNLINLLDLCAEKLEQISVCGSSEICPFEVFTRYAFPHLIELAINGDSRVPENILVFFVQNSPKLKNLTWRSALFASPDIICETLEKVELAYVTSEAELISFADRVPNLKQLSIRVNNQAVSVSDDFFRRIPNLEKLALYASNFNFNLMNSTHFWQLSLKVLRATAV